MKSRSIVAFVTFLLLALAADAQTTTFAYQGKLNDGGNPANGNYDLRFRLFDVNTNVIAGPVTNSPVGVTNGQFTVLLDFGSAVFDGSNRWLEIAVRNYGDTNSYTPLSPLQPITSVPYAIRSIVATSATNAMFLTSPLQGTNISGIVPIVNLPTNVAFLNSNQAFTAANTFSGVLTANNSANALAGTFSGAFNGNGIGLTNVAGTNLVGTVPDARLTANVALQSNTVINFSGSVAATNFIGAGHGLTNVPGAFFWVTVPGSSAQSYPNVGYICTNNVTPVTIALPASPSVGDTFKVAGVGDAGWIIAQKAGQNIFAGNLSSSVGQSWTASTSGLPVTANWTAITCSADGTKMAAANDGGYIYVSTNSGSTWSQPNTTNAYWSALASSADGTHLIAAAGYSTYSLQSGDVYVSSNSGANWTPVIGVAKWTGVASSANGGILVAVSHDGYLYISSSGGSVWSYFSTSYIWTSVASSSSGTNLVAVEANGSIFTSTNAGVSWLQRLTNSGIPWSSVASSEDGSRLVATTPGGLIYLSMDFGIQWVQENSGIYGDLTSVASSADGSRLAAAVGGALPGSIYGSSNSGVTWSQLAGSPSATWSGIASSADGSVLAATVYGGSIYVSSQAGTTSGAAGYLAGAQHSAIELIYTGNGVFLPLNHEGTIRAY